jgi:hypothetical protein
MFRVLRSVLQKSNILLCFFFCGKRDPMQRIITKKCFLFTVGSVFSLGGKSLLMTKSLNGGAEVAETTVKHYYVAVIDALVTPWDSVGGGYV